MKITQIRNATVIISYKDARIIVDPMLSPMGHLPKLKYFKNQFRNPLVELPNEYFKLKNEITHALITHCQKGHFDHLDKKGVKFLRENRIITFCTKRDGPYLFKKNIITKEIPSQKGEFFDGEIQTINAQHTRGFLRPFLEDGVGYYIKFPMMKSLYIMGDSVLTDEIKQFIKEHQPDFIIAATGKAQFDFGSPLLMDEKEIIELARLTDGKIIANHMDALDHCRIGRSNLRQIIKDANLEEKFIILEDGETLDLMNF